MALIITLATLFDSLEVLQQFPAPIRILYAQTDKISIEQYLLLQKSKMKVEFVPVPDMKDERVASGYLIGRLTAEAANTILVTESETLLSLGSVPAKGSAHVYFAKDLRQAQKIHKELVSGERKRVPRKQVAESKAKAVRTAKPKERPEQEPQKTKQEMFGFLNLPEDVNQTKPQEKEKLQTFLASNLGEKLAGEQYSNIVRSADKATEAIGWEILLRLEVQDRPTSDKIYTALSPKFAEMKKLIRSKEK